MKPKLLRSLRGRRGYTVVEVLSAMTLFAIGAAGVISMQRVTIMGGDDARRMDVAVNIAHEWTARLQRDAAYWTKPNSTDPNSNIADTLWLKNAPTSNWTTPTAPTAGVEGGRSGFFDLYGRDRASGTGDHMFCAQYRLSWIMPPGGGSTPRLSMVMRAEVRVFWARLDNAPILDCESLNPPPSDPAAATYYHFVYATTAVRPNNGEYMPGGADAGP